MAQTVLQPFQGYEITLPTLSSSAYFCQASEVWSTVGNRAACCVPGQVCQLWTACNEGTWTRTDGVTGTCPPDDPNCAQLVIFDKYPLPTSSWTKMHCAKDNTAEGPLYREIITSSVPPAATAPPTPSDTPQAQSSPPAWIAGPIVGGLAVIVVMVLSAFWLGMKWGRKREQSSEQTAPSGGCDHLPPRVVQNHGVQRQIQPNTAKSTARNSVSTFLAFGETEPR
ncbi:hypothetical protein B0T16DRAFT_423870 [Cercophora newfieldiana]|uniref:Uncharacterized protein n=1 Tax=Cercophora newfieldiana TaxID=92897 RepID=A0AA39XTE0_9PEZI|nr:hypothetical protein B0T16DRAFT_423870 [Cercophora newfieldiana]